jgi:hypothetical protein
LGETRITELLRDVGTALHRFVRQFVHYHGLDSWENTLPTGLETFIREYIKINPLTDPEILLLPLYAADELLRKLFDNIEFYSAYEDNRYLTDGELEKKLILLQEASLIRKELLKI